MNIAALAGGVGGAKLLVGLQRIAGTDLTAIVNTADDAEMYGVHVSPDVDIVTYWLAGIADVDRGWGLSGDTFEIIRSLERLGTETWFGLGDRDFATCLYRTQRLRQGATLSTVTDEIRSRLGVHARVLPMTDDRVRTLLDTDRGRLDFQTYFVKHRQEPVVHEVTFDGIGTAVPAPGVLEAITSADLVVLCPSNPLVSIGPILALPGVREALRAHERVTGVTPIVGGRALKGPADRMLAAAGHPATASGVAGLYRELCGSFVVDAVDEPEVAAVEELGVRGLRTDTIMVDHDASERLARFIVDAA